MKALHKFVFTLLALILALGLVACGDKKAPEAAQAAAPEAKVESNALENAALAHFAELSGDNNMIAQADFVEKIKAGEDLFILDIRQPDVYAKGHAKGAVNVPWGPAITDSLDKLPMDRPVLVYCYTGQTANQTVGALRVAGFDAKSVKFGWNLGISRVEGHEAIVETDTNELGESLGNEIPADILAAIEGYYTGLAGVKDGIWKNYKISEDNLKKLMADGDDGFQVVSIRKAEDFQKGHIPTAINIPWGKGMQENFSSLPTDKKLAVYCYTGQTAGQTVAILRLLGYDAYSLNGGMGTASNAPYGWSNKGFEVVTE